LELPFRFLVVSLQSPNPMRHLFSKSNAKPNPSLVVTINCQNWVDAKIWSTCTHPSLIQAKMAEIILSNIGGAQKKQCANVRGPQERRIYTTFQL
jgi:hypothetical protein